MAYNNITPVQLAQAAMTTSYVTIYTVPDKSRTYVKDIDIRHKKGAILQIQEGETDGI